MALSNSQYNAVMREYERQQAANRRDQEARIARVYARIPQMEKLDADTGARAAACARRVLGGEAGARLSLREELEDIRTTLAAQLYTLQNLATFFAPGYHVTLSDEAGAILLSPEEMGLARRAILEGEQVEDLLEVSQTVGDRPPRYTLTVRDTAGVELLRLGVYANESTQVYDSYHSGQQLLLCFSGELVPLCQGLLAGDDPP